MNNFGCVIDSNRNYVEYVTLKNGEPQFYSLNEGESVANVLPPNFRAHAGTEGIVKAKLENGEWIEAATAAEIEQWEQEHPAPDSASPSPIEKLQAENNLLKAQVAASADRQEFLEDCIAEMAMQVYSA